MAILFGPYNMALQMASADLGIHYLVTTLPEHPLVMEYTYYLLPHDDVIHSAVLDVMTAFKWQEQKVGIMYDNHQGKELTQNDNAE